MTWRATWKSGFTHDRAATSLWGSGGLAGLTLDSDTTVVYGTVSHRLAPSLYGSLTGQYQDSDTTAANITARRIASIPSARTSNTA